MISELLLAAQTLVPGTTQTWTDGIQTWAGNPFCAEAGFTLQEGSEAIDYGVVIEGFHCPLPGSALDQPLQADGSFCNEWYGAAPDAGACEFVGTIEPPPPPPPPPPTENLAPLVDAGGYFEAIMDEAIQVSGMVSDDGLPAGNLVWNWALVDAPQHGDVWFEDINRLDTFVVFGWQGVYILRLTASDGELISTADVTVRVWRR
jgi:hypothetical protein